MEIIKEKEGLAERPEKYYEPYIFHNIDGRLFEFHSLPYNTYEKIKELGYKYFLSLGEKGFGARLLDVV